jgi:hypothetical protein
VRNLKAISAIRAGFALVLALGVLASSTAAAQAAPILEPYANSNTTVEAGGQVTFYIGVRDIGSEPTSEPVEVITTLPPGLTLAQVESEEATCSGSVGSATATCTLNSLSPLLGIAFIRVTADVEASASGAKTALIAVSGGGAAPASTARTVRISPDPPPFGIEDLDLRSVAGPEASHSVQAGEHPYVLETNLVLNTMKTADPFFTDRQPVEPVKDIEVELPPGFAGNPSAVARCRPADLAYTEGPDPRPLCPPESQVGTLQAGVNFGTFAFGLLHVPVFNLAPPPGVAARFGFSVVGVVTVLDTKVRSGGDYGLTTTVTDIPQAVPTVSSRLQLWGVPSAPSHELQRSCPGESNATNGGEHHCPSQAPEVALLRNPTSCGAPGTGLPVTARADSWQNPGAFDTRAIVTHEAPDLPFAPETRGAPKSFENCQDVPFDPSISVSPTSDTADTPTGLDVELTLPQDEAGGTLAQSDLKKAVLSLPPGLSLNPSSASNLGSCSADQIGLLGTHFAAPAPIRFTPDPPSCPDSSKIGTVTIETAALDHPVQGSVYLAAQEDNPFGSLLAMYVVGVDPESGVVLKLPGLIEAGPDGQLVSTFDNNPQLPFESLSLRLFGGPRATLRTPSACGTYTSHAELTPWARPTEPVGRDSTFTISSRPGGSPCGAAPFAPRLAAGTGNPIAGSFSPFSLRIQRDDGNQELARIAATLPKGLLGDLRGIPYCPEAALDAISDRLGTGAAQERSPTCPSASLLGKVTIGSGAGPVPFFTESGRAYLAGPYKGAPLSLAVVTPAVAGPFDLGSVLVRNALQVNPETAQITAVSDPLPTILHGIPLDLRDVRVALNRQGFTLNPTSCEPMEITSRISSTLGATATPSNRFQVGGCDKLGFKPGLSIHLRGKTRRSGFPALRAVLTMPKKAGANIGRVSVALPRSEFLAQAHINRVCTRVQFAAGGGGGAGCPKGSVYGYARAFSPLLDQPLEGPVYLRSNGGERLLPDLVASLGGQIHIDLVGHIDENKRTHGIRTTFEGVPDAPVSRFVLSMPAGAKSLLENSTNICRRPQRATVRMTGQNGKNHNFNPLVRAKCGKGKGKRK